METERSGTFIRNLVYVRGTWFKGVQCTVYSAQCTVYTVTVRFPFSPPNSTKSLAFKIYYRRRTWTRYLLYLYSFRIRIINNRERGTRRQLIRRVKMEIWPSRRSGGRENTYVGVAKTNKRDLVRLHRIFLAFIINVYIITTVLLSAAMPLRFRCNGAYIFRL